MTERDTDQAGAEETEGGGKTDRKTKRGRAKRRKIKRKTTYRGQMEGQTGF